MYPLRGRPSCDHYVNRRNNGPAPNVVDLTSPLNEMSREEDSVIALVNVDTPIHIPAANFVDFDLQIGDAIELSPESFFHAVGRYRERPEFIPEYNVKTKTISTTDNGRSHLARGIMTTTARISKYQRNGARH